MQTLEAVLVILDISGYTRFIHHRSVSLEHAESIITALMEALIDGASHPLVVNKLEGDAALLYADTHGDPAAAMASVLGQVSGFFASFRAALARIRTDRGHCGCDACANVESLRLKAIVHIGPIVLKRVRQFEEIAGDAVILLHRLLKNDVPHDEYVLLTAPAGALLTWPEGALRDLDQPVDGMSNAALRWCAPAIIERQFPTPQSHAPTDAMVPAVRARNTLRFRHLPAGLMDRVLRSLARPFAGLKSR